MGVSTDGQICFGNKYEEEFQFPWDAEPFNGDESDWWRVECGFNPSQVVFDEHGEYLNGVKPSDEVIRGHFEEQTAFDKAHPLPFQVINYCSGDYPMWILAVPSTVRRNNRGEARRFEPTDLVVTDAETHALREFCIKHDLIPEEDAGWYLTSYWG